jgi:hypothetical protein
MLYLVLPTSQRGKPVNKFVVALATVVSLGLMIPAFAEDAKMPMQKMGKPHMMKPHHVVTVVHHHYHHHYHYAMTKPHHVMKPQTKPM